jgi:hypothetical protein
VVLELFFSRKKPFESPKYTSKIRNAWSGFGSPRAAHAASGTFRADRTSRTFSSACLILLAGQKDKEVAPLAKVFSTQSAPRAGARHPYLE